METQTFSSALVLKRVFGINPQPNTFFLLDRNTLIYVAGHNLVRLNIAEETQSFVAGNQTNFRISTVAVSENKNYLAIAEVSAKPSLYLYDSKLLTKKRYLLFVDNEFDGYEYVALRFRSNDDLVFCVLANDRNVAIVVWDLQSACVAASQVLENHRFNSIEFSTNDHAKFILLCEGWVRVMRLENKEFKTVSPDLIERLALSGARKFYNVVYDKAQDLFYFRVDRDKLAVIGTDGIFERLVPVDHEFSFIVPLDKGILFVAENFGVRRGSIIDSARCETAEFTRPADAVRFSSVWYSPQLELGLCLASHRQLFLFNPKPADEQFFRPLIDPGHIGSISCLDTCRRKSLVATAGTDKKLRIWNYAANRLEIDWGLNEEPVSLCLHPSGFYLVVAYPEKLVFENTFADVLTHKREVIKEFALSNVREARFSRGGDKLAVASGNPQVISLYRFFSFERIPHLTLRGHSARVTCLRFSPDDTMLYSAGVDGLVYRWNLINGQRTEVQTKGPPINCFALFNSARDQQLLFLAANEEKGLTELSECPHKHEDKSLYSAVEISKDGRLLFAANTPAAQKTQSGLVRHFRNLSNLSQAENFSAHGEEGASRLSLTVDDSMLASGGKDGTLCLFEVKSAEETASPACLDVLVTRSAIDELHVRIDNSPASDVDSAFQTNKILQSNLQEKVEALKEQLVLVGRNGKAELDALNETKKKKLAEYEAELAAKRARLHDLLTEQEHLQSKEYSEAARKYEDVKAMLKKHEKDLASQVQLLTAELSEAKKAEREELETKYETKQSELAKRQSDRVLEANRISQQLELLKRETVFERDTLEKQYKARLDQDVEDTMKTKNQVQSTKKKGELFGLQIQQMEENLKERAKNLEPLNQKKEDLNRKIAHQKELLKEKNAQITEKEKRIYELKKTTQELEKFKFVLDYTIKDLNKEVGPKEKEIKSLKTEIAKQDAELKKCNTKGQSQVQLLHHLDDKKLELKNKIEKTSDSCRNVLYKLEKLKKIIADCVQIDDVHAAQQKLNELISDQIEGESIPKDVSDEFEDQLKYLKNSVQNFKENIKKDAELHKIENRDYVEKNRDLIQKISEERREVKKIKISSKPEIILVRKQKKLKNILKREKVDWTENDRKEILAQLESEISKCNFIKKKLESQGSGENNSSEARLSSANLNSA